jgi:alanine racemase
VRNNNKGFLIYQEKPTYAKTYLRRTTPMHSWIELDSKALQSNFVFFKKLNKLTKTMAILKANAYGHGLKETYQALEPVAPPAIGVNYLFEAKTLRCLGYRGKLLIMGPISSEEIASTKKLKITVTISQVETLATWLRLQDKPNIHIKIDTGLSRQGFTLKEIKNIIPQLLPFKKHVIALMSHFACVEDVNQQDSAKQQIKALQSAQKIFTKETFKLKSHIAASAASLLLADSHFDMIRVGISLYGFWPSDLTRLSYVTNTNSKSPLTPVLSWRTKIAAVRRLTSGQAVGYGHTFKAPRHMQIAILPVGYYEGYPRLAGCDSRSHVLIQGKNCNIIGRICMNMMMVDISELADPKVGEIVTLIGKDQYEQIHAEQIAQWSQTIQYEIVTNLNPEIPRKLICKK